VQSFIRSLGVECTGEWGRGLTSKMSHEHGWRAAWVVTRWISEVHFELGEVARGVTAVVVGSGALFGKGWKRDWRLS
jgi:hypothetical protein